MAVSEEGLGQAAAHDDRSPEALGLLRYGTQKPWYHALWFDALRWDEKHRRLAGHPALAGCKRAEVRRLARCADETVIQPGQVLVREDRIGYWFFLIEEGTVRLTRRGRSMDELGPGDHLGDIAIVGFGPQPFTAIAVTPVRAFVVGRVPFLSLIRDLEPLQHVLYPDANPAAFAMFVRSMRTDGAVRWKSVRLSAVRPRSGQGDALAFRPPRPTTSSFTALAGGLLRHSGDDSIVSQPARPLSRRTIIAAAVAVMAALLLGAAMYHPPVIVVEPGKPFDVAKEITIHGAKTSPASGQYLVVPVYLRRPNAFGAIGAYLRGRRTIPAGHSDLDKAWLRREGKRSFHDSQHNAALAAARAAGLPVQAIGTGAEVVTDRAPGGLDLGDVVLAVDGRPVNVVADLEAAVSSRPAGRSFVLLVQRAGQNEEVRITSIGSEKGRAALPVTLATREPSWKLPFEVSFRDHEVVGPSGGMIYALAILDLLDDRDLAGGRVIAGTGEIAMDGGVARVSYVAEKAKALGRAGAHVFIVPRGQGFRSKQHATWEAADLREAAAVLERTRK